MIVNDKKINSVAGLEVFLGLSPGSISKSYRKEKEPGLKVIKIILEGLGINETWWKSGKGEVFSEKHTSESKTKEADGTYNEKQLVIDTLIKAMDAKDQLISALNDKIARLESDLKSAKKVPIQ